MCEVLTVPASVSHTAFPYVPTYAPPVNSRIMLRTKMAVAILCPQAMSEAGIARM